MPAESKHEQVMEAIKARLEAIAAGADYHYTPTRVERVSFFTDDPFNRAIGESVYFLHPGDEELFEEGSSGSMRGEAETFLVVARQHEGATENPYQESVPTRWQVGNRMVRDVVKKLFADVSLGGLAYNLITDSLMVERGRYMAGWVLVELRFVVTYTLTAAEP